MIKKINVYLLGFFLTLMSGAVNSKVTSRMDTVDLFDSIITRYHETASTWSHIIIGYASTLFWSLVLISMVWTYGMMALRKADIQEFCAETVRFLVTTGFFYWLLLNGPAIADSIMESLRQLAANATGLDKHISPSGIVDVGFDIVSKVIDHSSLWKPVDTGIGLILAGIILMIFTYIALNLIIILITGWILTYGGVFVLGFGGGRWTQDIAINYYKTVLGIALQAFTMLLLIGIGKSFIDQYYALMNQDVLLKEMFIMLVVSCILLVLINKIPPVLGSLVSGGGGGGSGGGGGVGGSSLGVGSAMGAAGVAASTAGMAFAAGAGGLSALTAAFKAASQSASESGGVFSGAESSSKLGGLAQAMGEAGKFAGSVGAHLAAGAVSAASDKLGDMKESFSETVSSTTGGKVADAINQSSNSSSSNDSSENSSSNTESMDLDSNVESLSVPDGSLGGESVDSSYNAEVASFADKSINVGEQ